MRAALRGCPSCALLRTRAICNSFVPALSAFSPPRAAAASSNTDSPEGSGKKRRGTNNHGHRGWDRRESFWDKWEGRSQQQFWQQVALEEDKRSESWRNPVKSKVGRRRHCTGCHTLSALGCTTTAALAAATFRAVGSAAPVVPLSLFLLRTHVAVTITSDAPNFVWEMSHHLGNATSFHTWRASSLSACLMRLAGVSSGTRVDTRGRRLRFRRHLQARR